MAHKAARKSRQHGEMLTETTLNCRKLLKNSLETNRLYWMTEMAALFSVALGLLPAVGCHLLGDDRPAERGVGRPAMTTSTAPIVAAGPAGPRRVGRCGTSSRGAPSSPGGKNLMPTAATRPLWPTPCCSKARFNPVPKPSSSMRWPGTNNKAAIALSLIGRCDGPAVACGAAAELAPRCSANRVIATNSHLTHPRPPATTA